MPTPLVHSGTPRGIRHLYVDSMGGPSIANGSSDAPFSTVADALAVCNPSPAEPSVEGLKYVKRITCAGYFENVVIDRPAIIEGPCIFLNLKIVSSMVYLRDLHCFTLIIEGTTFTTVNSISTVNFDCSGAEVLADNFQCDSLRLYDGTIMDMNAAVVHNLATVEEDSFLKAFNSVIHARAGLGDIDLVNSEISNL